MRFPWQRARRRPSPRPPVPDEILAFHRTLPVADFHAHPLLPLTYGRQDPGRRHRRPTRWSPLLQLQWDLPRALDAGVTLQCFTVYVPMRPPRRLADQPETWRQLEVLDRWLARHASHVGLAKTTDEARQLNDAGKLAVFIAVEGGHSLGGDVGQVARLRAHGARYLTLVHFADNGLAQGVEQRLHRQEPLTSLGREVLGEMARCGMLLDVAHLTDRSFEAVCSATDMTLVSTHGGVRSLSPHERNLADWQVDEIARRGGLIGVIAMPFYLKRGGLWGHVEDMVDVFCWLASRVGPEHVCLGSDFDGFIFGPCGLMGVDDLPRLTWLLLQRGFSEGEVAGVMGGNLWRLLERVDGEGVVGG